VTHKDHIAQVLEVEDVRDIGDESVDRYRARAGAPLSDPRERWREHAVPARAEPVGNGLEKPAAEVRVRHKDKDVRRGRRRRTGGASLKQYRRGMPRKAL
jgi:hypothetical protein